MAKVLWTGTILVVIQAVHSYILLTANLDDIRNIGQRVAESPIGGQVSDIVRRAYNVFNAHLGRERANMRTNDEDIVLAYQPDEKTARRQDDSTYQGTRDENREASDERRLSSEIENSEFSALGNSASVYLQKIKQIFEKA